MSAASGDAGGGQPCHDTSARDLVVQDFIRPESPDLPALDDAGRPEDSHRAPASSTKHRFTAAFTRLHREGSNRHDKGNDGSHSKRDVGLRLLHASSEPLIDLIFVHGLKGDSVKTWRMSGDPETFWPQSWLPKEAGLENVNTYTFGYDSDWASSKASILDVNDFGQALLEDMRNAPNLRDSGERPIILLGHSMGGLIIKKAYILAQDVPDFKHRIQTIFFLSTPHKGSEYAATLNNILSVSGFSSSRHYIADLTAGSASLQLINDEFARYARELPIFSFHETLKMKVGIFSILVVDKTSALLGEDFKNERCQYIDADHRDMCKFRNIHDPNYIRVRNALVSAVASLIDEVSIKKFEKMKQQVKELKAFLGVSDSPDEYYSKVKGSCEWIDAREDFQAWRNYDASLTPEHDTGTRTESISIFWVHANPGTGKTVLASHVVSRLQELHVDCAFYYFHMGNKSSSSLSAFLRSVALQMASSNPTIRERLHKLQQEGSNLDLDDSQAIWMKIFKKCILQAQVSSPQYWVIDALDECNKYQEMFTMLKGLRLNFPLLIFITSREVHDMKRLQKSLEPATFSTCIEIPTIHSLQDIELYIQSRMDSLPTDDYAQRTELADQILQTSNASFLWVRLVLDELETVYSSDSIVKVLDKIPQGMKSYYERTIQVMASNKLEKHITKAILAWAVVSARKLTVSELSEALKLDINAVLPSGKSAVQGLCGQLLTVNDSGFVDLVHPTAQEFLVSSADEFTVCEPNAHSRVAMVCLKLLSGKDLRPPRNRRFLSKSRPPPTPLLEYAMTQFSEHVHLALSESDELLTAVDKFFKTNPLSWIERLALTGNIHCLIRASRNLKIYLSQRAKTHSPQNSSIQNIEGWSTDLSRVATQFGRALIQDPSSIYYLIAPLCPSESSIYRAFGGIPDGLSLVGRQNPAWDDWAANISFGENTAVATSRGETLIAVAMCSNSINLYNHRSYKKEAVIHHKDPICLVHLSDDLIVLCTTKAIVLQDLNGNVIWQKRIRFECFLLTSTDDSVVAVSQHGHLLKWDRLSGDLTEDKEFPYRHYDLGEVSFSGIANPLPHVASLSPDMEMLALGYGRGAVCLWDIHEREFVAWAIYEASKTESQVLFNPNSNIDLLLVTYDDHALALYDTWTGNLMLKRSPPIDAGLLAASCSPDGRTLVTMDTSSNMHIWDFETLSVLYHVHSPYPGFRMLDFTSDGGKIIDVMHSSMRIWSPAVLVRKIDEDYNTIYDAIIEPIVTEGDFGRRENDAITAICHHQTHNIVFAGRDNGQVVVFDSTANTPITTLFGHSGICITQIAVSTTNVLASSDVNGNVMIWQLSSGMTKIAAQLGDIRQSSHVKQLCFSASSEHLLVSTANSDCIYLVSDGSCIGTWNFQADERRSWRWFLLPQREGEESCFTLLCDGVLQTHSASSFPRRANDFEVRLQYETPQHPGIDTAVVHEASQILWLQIRYSAGLTSPLTSFLFDLSTLGVDDPPTSLLPLNQSIIHCCKYGLGISEATQAFVFLHSDSWISSIDISGLQGKQYNRHFFVPNDYVPGSLEVPPVKTLGDDIVFCPRSELFSVKNGLNFSAPRELP